MVCFQGLPPQELTRDPPQNPLAKSAGLEERACEARGLGFVGEWRRGQHGARHFLTKQTRHRCDIGEHRRRDISSACLSKEALAAAEAARALRLRAGDETEIAAQLILMSGLSRRELPWCSAVATSSLPVPDSPVISTVEGVSATLSMTLNSSSMRTPSPMMLLRALPSGATWPWLASCVRAALATTARISACSKGLVM